MVKGKALALIAIFAAIGLVTATGAFTTVTAERTATVNVAGDASALLGLQEGSASQYFANNGNGQLTIDLTNVNMNAGTAIDGLFTIQNNGQQAVVVYLQASNTNNGETDNADAVTFAVKETDSNGNLAVQQSNGDPAPDNVHNSIGNDVEVSITGSAASNGIVIGEGDSLTVGMYIDTGDGNPSNAVSPNDYIPQNEGIITQLTITADADLVDSDTYAYLYSADGDGDFNDEP